MNVLKFGGTSVANAHNIKLVCDIVTEKATHERIVVVVSAFSGVTDLLLSAANKAASKDQSYKDILESVKTKHVEAIHDLVGVSSQTALLTNWAHCSTVVSFLAN